MLYYWATSPGSENVSYIWLRTPTPALGSQMHFLMLSAKAAHFSCAGVGHDLDVILATCLGSRLAFWQRCNTSGLCSAKFDNAMVILVTTGDFSSLIDKYCEMTILWGPLNILFSNTFYCFKNRFIILFIYLSICVYMCVQMCGFLWSWEEGVGFPVVGAGVLGNSLTSQLGTTLGSSARASSMCS